MSAFAFNFLFLTSFYNGGSTFRNKNSNKFATKILE